jgi:hypothetical protein
MYGRWPVMAAARPVSKPPLRQQIFLIEGCHAPLMRRWKKPMAQALRHWFLLRRILTIAQTSLRHYCAIENRVMAHISCRPLFGFDA